MSSIISDHPSHTLQVGDTSLALEGPLESFHVKMASAEVAPFLHHVDLQLSSNKPIIPSPLKLIWRYPIIDVQAIWHPGCNAKRWLTMPWEVTAQSQATQDAPVISLYNRKGENRLTFACSDALNHLESTASVEETTAAFSCHLHFFSHPTAPLKLYRAILRIDQRPCPYYQSLHDVQVWWSSQSDKTPSPVPEAARWPMYSTWYSFHQDLNDAAVEYQCILAKKIGCDAVIIDDGWQTEDTNLGYAYCGDWEVCKSKFPDMTAHVDRLHQLGMKCLLWFSVPFIGFQSRAYPQFKGKYLFELQDRLAAVLDPRYPEVREYLITLYEKAIREWNFDGLKLDFVDQFTPREANYMDDANGRDIISVPVAVDRLLRDTRERLCRIKPDILIEFRQPYIGPLMRHYGNLFRASDCPNDATANRVRTIDVRLLAGTTATHSDMLMWSCGDAVECAALQFLNILFSVPQISVKLDQIPEGHQRMLSFWIRFWRKNRDTLLDGILEPHYPELQYPFVIAKKERQWVGVVYADIVAHLSEKLPDELFLINAASSPRIVLDVKIDSGPYQVEERNVLGQIVDSRTEIFSAGIRSTKISPSGLLHLKRI